MHEPHAGAPVGQSLERQQAVEQLRGARLGIAGEQGGQRVEHHQVERLLTMQRLQAGDQGEPLRVGGTSCQERAAEKLDVRAQAELAASGVPVGRGFFGDNEGAGRRNRSSRQPSAVGEVRQQVGEKSRFARFWRADQGGNLARRQVTPPKARTGGAARRWPVHLAEVVAASSFRWKEAVARCSWTPGG